MPEQFLYQELDAFSHFGGLKNEIPQSVAQDKKYRLIGVPFYDNEDENQLGVFQMS